MDASPDHQDCLDFPAGAAVLSGARRPLRCRGCSLIQDRQAAVRAHSETMGPELCHREGHQGQGEIAYGNGIPRRCVRRGTRAVRRR